MQLGVRGGDEGQPPHETLLSLSRLLRSLAADLEQQVREVATTCMLLCALHVSERECAHRSASAKGALPKACMSHSHKLLTAACSARRPCTRASRSLERSRAAPLRALACSSSLPGLL